MQVKRSEEEDPNASLGLMVEKEKDREENSSWIHGEGMGDRGEGHGGFMGVASGENFLNFLNCLFFNRAPS